MWLAQTPPKAAVYTQQRGLIVFTREAYMSHWHGIREREVRCQNLRSHASWSPLTPSSLLPRFQVDTIQPWVSNAGAPGVSVGAEIPRRTRVSLTVRRVLHVTREREVLMTQSAQEEERRKERALYNAIRDDRGS